MATGGDTGGDSKAVGRGGVGNAGKAEPIDQGGMRDQIGAQVGHIPGVRVELDEIGGGEGDTRVGLRARPGAVGGTLGELLPG